MEKVVRKYKLGEEPDIIEDYLQLSYSERLNVLTSIRNRLNYFKKTSMEPDFREFIELLKKHEVEFIIVGGFAVALHGYPRFTDDLDVLVKRDKENANRLLQAVTEFGFGSLGLEVEDFTKDDMIVQLGYPPLRIDIITSISGIEDYKQLFENAISIEAENMHLKIISLDDLIKNKESTNRSIDRTDALKLKKIRAKLSKNKS